MGGVLGDSSDVESRMPIGVAGGIVWRSVAATAGLSCGLSSAGAAYYWSAKELYPTAVPGGVTFASIAVGASNACGIGADGHTYCWSWSRTYTSRWITAGFEPADSPSRWIPDTRSRRSLSAPRTRAP